MMFPIKHFVETRFVASVQDQPHRTRYLGTAINFFIRKTEMKFIITAPPYNEKSAGCVMLYTLHDELKNCGYDAEIMQFDMPYHVDDNTIVVYPEVVSGNPLGAKNVVRYYLNREGLASGNKVNAGPNDFILAFNKLYYSNPHAILRYEKLNPYCHDAGTKPTLERKLDCTYIGKGVMYSDKCTVIDGTIEITRTAPAEKQGLADMLSQTRYLFTYDICTALTAEAILSGAVVVPIMFYPYTAEELEYPFASTHDNSIHIPDDYDKRRLAFLSMILNFNLAAQTKEFAKKAITHFVKLSVFITATGR